MRTPFALGIVAGCAIATWGGCILCGQEPPPLPLVPPPASVTPLEHVARVQLDRADSLLRSGSYEEAIETLRRVADSHGEQLIVWPSSPGTVPSRFTRYAPVRELVWMKVAALHRLAPDALMAFRKQVDPQAKRWLDQASGNAELSLESRIVEELFLSSVADEALLRLGDAALERGDYNSARRAWERIAPGLRFPIDPQRQWIRAADRPLWLPFVGVDVAQAWPKISPWFAAPENPDMLIYPDTDLEVASVRARLVLASILEGNRERAAIELAILRQIAPASTGTIAGRQGKLVDLVQDFLEQSQHWRALDTPDDWPTWAGSPARNRVAPAVAEFSNKPLWSVPLPRWSVEREALSLNRVRVAEDARGLLPYYPLVVGDWVVLQTQPTRDQVQAYQLRTGEPVLPIREAASFSPGLFDRHGLLGVPRFTPAADGKFVFLLEGLPIQGMEDNRRSPSATVTAIDLAAERKLLWQFAPESSAESTPLALAGPPTVDGSRVYVTLRRREAARDETFVAALDARDGKLLWKQFLGTAEPAIEVTWSVLTHQMLTVHEGTLYCNTNAGLVAALEASTGRVRWMTSYPRAGLQDSDLDRNQLHFYRDLNPCLVHRDTLVVAPNDCNRIFALDTTTGITLWVTPAELAADAIHLLGVTENRLVVSGECVYWFDIRTGSLAGRYPEPFKASPGFARPSPRGYGRGILAGHRLYWPTRNAILVFDQRSLPRGGPWQPVIERRVALEELGATGGNLVLANDTLLIAGADRLFALAATPEPTRVPTHGTQR